MLDQRTADPPPGLLRKHAHLFDVRGAIDGINQEVPHRSIGGVNGDKRTAILSVRRKFVS